MGCLLHGLCKSGRGDAQADKLPVVDASCSFIVENERLLHKFGFRLAQLVAPGAQKNVVQGAIAQAVEELRDAAVAGGNPFGGFPRARDAGLAAGKNLELVFVHDCRWEVLEVRP